MAKCCPPVGEKADGAGDREQSRAVSRRREVAGESSTKTVANRARTGAWELSTGPPQNGRQGADRGRRAPETSECAVLDPSQHNRNPGKAAAVEPGRVGRNPPNTSNATGGRSVKNRADYAGCKAYSVSHEGVGMAGFRDEVGVEAKLKDRTPSRRSSQAALGSAMSPRTHEPGLPSKSSVDGSGSGNSGGTSKRARLMAAGMRDRSGGGGSTSPRDISGSGRKGAEAGVVTKLLEMSSARGYREPEKEPRTPGMKRR